MNIHLRKAGVESGPFSFLQVQAMWKSGALTADVQWRWDAEQIWRALKDLEASLSLGAEQQSAAVPPVMQASQSNVAPKKGTSPLAVIAILIGCAISLCFLFSLIAALTNTGTKTKKTEVVAAKQDAVTTAPAANNEAAESADNAARSAVVDLFIQVKKEPSTRNLILDFSFSSGSRFNIVVSNDWWRFSRPERLQLADMMATAAASKRPQTFIYIMDLQGRELAKPEFFGGGRMKLTDDP